MGQERRPRIPGKFMELYLYLCTKCGHAQRDEGPCYACSEEEMERYVRTFKPEEVKGLKYWTDRLAKKRKSFSHK